MRNLCETPQQRTSSIIHYLSSECLLVETNVRVQGWMGASFFLARGFRTPRTQAYFGWEAGQQLFFCSTPIPDLVTV